MSRCCAGGWFPLNFGLSLLAVGLICASGWGAMAPRTAAEPPAASAGQGNPTPTASRRSAPASQDTQDKTQTKATEKTVDQDTEKPAEKVLETATFGSGCYWCTEAVFQRVKGVENVRSGFMGGHIANPTYEQVCTGLTGHAEVLHLQFDPAVVSYEKLLEIFWSSHDPTTLNRQGNDVGPMYRSAIFYHNEDQKLLAVKYKERLTEARAFNAPIVTEITEASDFYAAPDYHQDYYNRNKSKNPYCKMITYKLQNFRKAFKDVIDTDKDKIK